MMYCNDCIMAATQCGKNGLIMLMVIPIIMFIMVVILTVILVICDGMI